MATELRLRIMSWNIRHCMVTDLENEGRISLPRIASVIDEVSPDIVGLQEVDRFWPRSGNVDQAQELAATLRLNHWFGPNLVLSDGDANLEYGTASLSRFAAHSWSNTHLPNQHGMEQRGVLQVGFEASGQRFQFLNTHLQFRHSSEGRGDELRQAQVGAILSNLDQIEVPTILVGDFNATPETPEIRMLLEAGLNDAWAEAGDGGLGNTIVADPARPPEQRIDYIFVSRHWKVEQAQVLITPETRTASDHYPLVIDVKLLS